MTRPTAAVSITAPIAIGSTREDVALIQVSIAGSTDRYATATMNSPGPGTGTASVVSFQSDGVGTPTGRAASRI